MPSQFQGTSFLLTYSQSEFDFDDFDGFLERCCSVGSVGFLRVGKERHASGDPHWHALVRFDAKQRFTDPRTFDWRSVHPNIKPVGRKVSDWNNCYTYVAKDGEYRDFGSPRHQKQSMWADFATAESRTAALALVAEHSPRDFIINRRQLDYAMDAMWPLQQAVQYSGRPLSSFLTCPALLEWMCGNFQCVIN